MTCETTNGFDGFLACLNSTFGCGIIGIGFIKARIAQGLSQKDLAERLKLKEQQIQRYEATDYASASLNRIKEVVTALGIDIGEPASAAGSRW